MHDRQPSHLQMEGGSYDTPEAAAPCETTNDWTRGSRAISRGGSYDFEVIRRRLVHTGEGYAGGDAYDYGGAPPVDAPKQNLDVKGFVPDRKTGLIMCAAGTMATMLGISLFFEKNLIRVGNILLVLGAPIVVGPARASRYVLAPAKLRATLVFAFGFFLILSGRPLLGICVEAFGFLNLFGNLFPMLGVMLRSLPFVPGGGNTGGIQEGAAGLGGMPMPPPQGRVAGVIRLAHNLRWRDFA